MEINTIGLALGQPKKIGQTESRFAMHRRKAGLTVPECAFALGLPREIVAALEEGSRRFASVVDAAYAIGSLMAIQRGWPKNLCDAQVERHIEILKIRAELIELGAENLD